MTTEQNKAIAERFIQAWSAGSVQVVDELAAPDIVVRYSHFPAPVQGAEQFKQILEQTHLSFPDMQVAVDQVTGEGERVVVEWNYRGTHKEGEVFGIAPVGRRVQVAGITVYRIANGRVVEERGVVDNLSLRQQLKGIK